MNWYKIAKVKIKQKNGYKVRKGQFDTECNRKNYIVNMIPDTDIVN